MYKLINEKGEEVFETRDILRCQKRYSSELLFGHTNIDVRPLQNALEENANKLSDEKSSLT